MLVKKIKENLWAVGNVTIARLNGRYWIGRGEPTDGYYEILTLRPFKRLEDALKVLEGALNES